MRGGVPWGQPVDLCAMAGVLTAFDSAEPGEDLTVAIACPGDDRCPRWPTAAMAQR